MTPKNTKPSLQNLKSEAELSEWNPVDDLDNSETIAAYLNSIIETGNPELIGLAVSDILQAHKKNTGIMGIDSEKLLEALLIPAPTSGLVTY